MKPRDRVLTALNRETPDRVPFQATFTPEFAERLRKKYKIHKDKPHDPHSGIWNGYELEKTTKQDALQCSIGWCTNYYFDVKDYTDNWGVKWRVDSYETPFGTGHYTNIKEGPLHDYKNIESYQPPDPNLPGLYTNLQRLIKEEKSEYYIIGRLHTTVYETAWALRGMDNLLCDMALEPDKANRILDIPYKYHLEVAKKMAKYGVDMIWLADDMGAQNTMIIDPKMWRQYFKPRMAYIISEIKKINPDVAVAYHTDGYNLPIIPDLIEIGLDVLNPIQAESMDPVELKDKFGAKLSFFGAIDVQSTLPLGSPDDVKNEFSDRFNTIGKGGGWLCAPTHHLQMDTPLENLEALISAVQETKY